MSCYQCCDIHLWTVNASGWIRMESSEEEGPRENLGFDVFCLKQKPSPLFLTSCMPVEFVFHTLFRAPCSSLYGRSIPSVCSHPRPQSYSETHGGWGVTVGRVKCSVFREVAFWEKARKISKSVLLLSCCFYLREREKININLISEDNTGVNV